MSAACNLFDAEGRLINTSTAWPAPTVNVADRPYFRISGPSARAGHDHRAGVQPHQRRLDHRDRPQGHRQNGEFIGAVGRGIESANFEKFFATVALAQGAAIAMHHRDGTLLARYPHVAEMIGKNFRNGPAIQQQVFEMPHHDVAPDQPD